MRVRVRARTHTHAHTRAHNTVTQRLGSIHVRNLAFTYTQILVHETHSNKKGPSYRSIKDRLHDEHVLECFATTVLKAAIVL